MSACQSYRLGEGICADGFPQRPYCAGQAGCSSCGEIPTKRLPLCLADEVPPHIADDRGMPRLFSLSRKDQA